MAQAILEVDLAAIVANWRTLSERHPSGPVAAVIKGDGYGLGARPVATAVRKGPEQAIDAPRSTVERS